MKTRIKKIIIMAVAMLFVSVGVSFAHDGNRGNHKPRGHAYGHNKKGYDDHHGWHNKRHKSHGHAYRPYRKWHGHHPGWNKKHVKRWHHYRDRYRYREVDKVRHHYHHQDRHAPRRGTTIGFKVNEPGFKFAVVVKDRR